MRNNKTIDPSLIKKIIQNDEKLKILYNKEGNISKQNKKGAIPPRTGVPKKTETNLKMKDDSFSEFTINTYNGISPPYDIGSRESKTTTTNKNEPIPFVQRMQRRQKYKTHREEKKNNTIFYTTYSNTCKNVDNNNNKKKKAYNKEQVDELVNRLYRNDYQHKKQINIEENNNKDNNNDFDMEEFIERMEEAQKKRNENLENKKRQLEENDKKKFTFKPKMSKGSRKYNEGNKDNFFDRQKNFNEKKAQKEEKLKEILKKKEEEEIKKNNILLKNDKKSDKKVDIQSTINSLYDWEKQRKTKLEQKKEESNKVKSDYKFMPTIDEKSIILAEKKTNQKNFFERLEGYEKMSKEKRKILKDMLTPSFKPFNYAPRNINPKTSINKKGSQNQFEEEEEEDEEEDDRRSRKKKTKKYKKEEDDSEEEESGEDEEDEEDEDSEEEEEEKEKEEEKNDDDDFDFQQDALKYAEDDVQDALRNIFFNKKRKSKK